ncbi:MAG: hypothetical protein BWY42_01570 [Candidatus Omnitrophica bacterium ADurb.Bin277]|nr:MAG: hypothetical protein BWY42_01570 [Candidatus Omnitrophica bacterium ADurb.Bin277]
MTHDLGGLREFKMSGKGGPHILPWVLRGEFLSGYMYPEIHKSLRRADRMRKRKMRYE